MTLSINEIRRRATEFAHEWEDANSESADKQSFWNDFFEVFGVTRKRVASYEEQVKLSGSKKGKIDLFWKGNLIVEHKTRGKPLEPAYKQALDYFEGIEEKDLPRYILVSDFNEFVLHDLEERKEYRFKLNELSNNIHLFDFIIGYKSHSYEAEDPVNIKAAEKMGMLHDDLLKSGYKGHQLEVFLVRILFCLFADDTGIFNKDHFAYYIDTNTKEDGSDLGSQLNMIFQILNTTEDRRQTTLDEDLNQFPYVDGKLFIEVLDVPAFDSGMRKKLLDCCDFDWSKISPAIFGSLFQSAMDIKKRKDLGGHYTSEQNVMKVIRGLFLDDLYNDFEKSKNGITKLEQLHEKISNLKFLDPACGCGNFLILSYREIRLLEIKILKRLSSLKEKTQIELDIQFLSKIDVDCMYGIEYEEFAAKITEVSLWLMDHQMNIKLSQEFGPYYIRIPLKKSPNIVFGNALRLNWEDIVAKSSLSYILGNPPFIAKHNRAKEQTEDMEIVCSHINSWKSLDYVCAWYVKATEYIKNTKIKVAFVSTNSISQGEQVGILWSYLLNNDIKINFAHRTFKWTNEAKGVAQVFVIIIGFSTCINDDKYIYDYSSPTSSALAIKAKNINPYLIDFDNIVVNSRRKPICNVPFMKYGSKPVDNGYLILSDIERENLVNKEPESIKYLKPMISADEFIEGKKRWCLWLLNINPQDLKIMPLVSERIEKVRKYRLSSKKLPTIKSAEYSYLFGEIRQPKNDFLLIPLTSSENRKYIPLALLSKEFIVSNSCSFIENANYYHFGVLTSIMHMTWVKLVCGRLTGRIRYSNVIVYNNFPWPKEVKESDKEKIELAVKEMINVRAEFPKSTLFDLYNPSIMPKKLLDVHKEIDRAVDRCYGKTNFKTEMNRLQFLFELYKEYTMLLI